MTTARTRQTAKKGRGRFLTQLAETGNVWLSCQSAGLGRSTVYGWRKTDVSFRDEWDDALEGAVDVLEAEARRRAVEGVSEPVFYQGQEVGAVKRYSDVLLIFLLKGLRPQRYNLEAHLRVEENRAIFDKMTKLRERADELELQQREAAAGRHLPPPSEGQRLPAGVRR